MVEATVNSVTTTFTYRGDGLRDSRTTGMTTTTFTWDINAGLPVVLDDGSQYVYGTGLEAMLTGGGTYYCLADGLGSTMAMIDSTGAVQKSYTYDVYGKPTATGALPNEFDFAGQQTDPTGLQYLRARYMDPETGTFVSREPLSAMPGWTGSAFGYAGARVCTDVDPSGLAPTRGEPPTSACDEIFGRIKSLARELIARKQEYFQDQQRLPERGPGRSRQGERKAYGQKQEALGKALRSFEHQRCSQGGRQPTDYDPQVIDEANKLAGEYQPLEKLESRDIVETVGDWLDGLPPPPNTWWDGDPVSPWRVFPPIGPKSPVLVP